MEDLNSDIKLKYKNMLTLIDQLYSIDVNSSEVNEKIQDLINHLREIRFIITNPCDQVFKTKKILKICYNRTYWEN